LFWCIGEEVDNEGEGFWLFLDTLHNSKNKKGALSEALSERFFILFFYDYKIC
jgi:hypothetical protein